MSRAAASPAPVPRATVAPSSNALLAIVRRRWRVLAGCTILSLALAAVYLATAARRYASTASLYVRPRGGAALATDATFLNTQREIVASMPVALVAMRE